LKSGPLQKQSESCSAQLNDAFDVQNVTKSLLPQGV
jgi:hypothetical protein